MSLAATRRTRTWSIRGVAGPDSGSSACGSPGRGGGAIHIAIWVPPEQAEARVAAALPEILAGLRLGAIRGVKGVVIGQLLIAILGVGELFETYSQNFLFEEFWALVIVVFAFAYLVSEAVARLERRVEHYARAR